MATVIMLVFFLLGAALLTVAASAGRTGSLQRDRLQAHYTAEAGAEYVLARLVGEPAWARTLPAEKTVLADFPYAGGIINSVNVKKSVAGEVYDLLITSSGTYGEGKGVVQVRARYTPPAEEKGFNLEIVFWHEQYPVF